MDLGDTLTYWNTNTASQSSDANDDSGCTGDELRGSGQLRGRDNYSKISFNNQKDHEDVQTRMNSRVLVTTPRPNPRNIGYAHTSSLDCAPAEAISAKKIVNMTNPVKVMAFRV